MSPEPKQPMILATSLVPDRDEALQRSNVESWKAAGFEVISVNGAAEAEALKSAYPDVRIVIAEKTAERVARKPVPHIHDLLKALRERCTEQSLPLDQCIVGIINADIYLRAVPALAKILRAQTPGALVLGPRVDVNDASAFSSYSPTGDETYSVGYDYFVMSGELLDDFAESPFAMGMPFWDYWLPLVALLNGRTLRSLNAPVALHVHHDTEWDDTIYLFFHSLVAYVIELCRKTVGHNQSASARQFDFLFDVLSHVYGRTFEQGTSPGTESSAPDPAGIGALADFYDRFQEVVVHHIKSRAETITVPEA
jgi:hypothetical protein